jgi:hypothetical protein
MAVICCAAMISHWDLFASSLVQSTFCEYI